MGNPEKILVLEQLTIGDFRSSLSIENLVRDQWGLHEQLPQDAVCEIVIPSLGIVEVWDRLKRNVGRFLGIDALEQAAPGEYDACFRIKRGEQIVSQTYVPIRKVENPALYPHLECGSVDEGFAERIEQLRKQEER